MFQKTSSPVNGGETLIKFNKTVVVQRAFGEQYVLDYQFQVIENQL